MNPLLQREVAKDTIFKYWQLTLMIGLAVIAVVASLLEMVTRTAESIQEGASTVWQVGKLIANNTVHVPLLVRVNENLEEISRRTDGIARSAERIQRTASSGPGKEG